VKSLSLKIQRIEESQTLALAAKASELKRAGIDVVSLTAGEPDFPTPAHVKMAAIKAIEENFTHYTANRGIPELLKAIVDKFERENNLHFTTEQILVSCGAKQAIYNVLQAICNTGDEVVFQSPYWVSYPEIVKLVDARPVVIPTTHENQFKITAQQLRKTINAKTKALIFNSPSNPTGTVYSQGEIEELAEVVKQTGMFVISDEIYEKVLYDGAKHFSIGSIKAIRDHVITVNGVSKAYAMTGWRIGYLGGPRSIVEAAAKVQSQTTSNATSISQRAALAALIGPTTDIEVMTQEFRRRRDFIVSELKKIDMLEFESPRGAVYVFPSVRNYIGKRINGKIIRDDISLCEYFLEEEHVAMIPGSAFGAKNYLRLSYACSMKELENAVERLKQGFRKIPCRKPLH
jgi:aspartate aminotransferase